MASGRYSFIDIAVLEEVRVRFAAGEALVLLSVDLDEVFWANGAGAALLGHRDVESVMGASPGLGLVARRQIAAVPGFPRMGRDRAVMVRLARGATSRAVPFTISAVTLPDGVPAILLALRDESERNESEAELSERIVAGFNEAGYFAALLDAHARLSAASAGFSQLGISQETLATLVEEVAHEGDRLVKRLIPAREGLIPAGIARLTDEPALHLIIAVDAPIEDVAPVVPEAAPVQEVKQAAAPSDADLPELVTEIVVPPVGPDHDFSDRDADDWYFSHAEDRMSAGHAEGRIDAPVFGKRIGGKPEAREADAGVEEQAVMSPALKHTPPDLNAGPVRFSWRTDAKGAFSAISNEFIAAVGSQAANVVGRSFKDVAAQFGLDEDGEIASLLERRDTWSGRTVMWPVAGTGLAAPVDLAALPVYNREREFEGFRGFGVVRMGDVIPDTQARGLKIDEAGQTAETLPDEADEHALSLDPFRSEVPVIEISERLRRRASDKIIRLAEHRPPQPEPHLEPDLEQEAEPQPEPEPELQPEPRPEPTPGPKAETKPQGGLSAVERSAFEEIRARLRRETTPLPDEARLPAPEPVVAETENNEREDLSAVSDEALIASGSAGGERRPFITPELISALPLPLLVHAGDVLHFANREFLDLTGYASLEQIRREGGLDRLFVEDAPAKETETADGHKLRLRTLGGEVFAVDAHLQSVRWQEGTALLLAVRRVEEPSATEPASQKQVVQDDERDLALADLERRLAELRTIIDTATDGVVLIAPDGMIRNISRPAEALFGFDSAEVEGKPFVTLLAMESRKSARDYLAGLADNGVASLLNDGREVIGREREGRFVPLFMTIGRLPGDSGYCAVVRDITHFKRAEEEMAQARARAERASSQKTEFLARVSHEVRTPLNAIIGFSELMMDEKFGPIGSDRYRDYLRDINRSGNHVLDLVNDLLDISKIEAGEQEMNYEAVSLNEALAEAVAMMQPQANRERVIIRSSLASSLPEVVADLRSVRQIALNLLSNAVRYTQAGGQVIVSTAYEATGDVVLRVRDTGIGMTLAEIDQALKPFKQINALKRGRNDGTGLGLPLTKAMVEANRARFLITSTPGEGTLVEIMFPSTRVLAG